MYGILAFRSNMLITVFLHVRLLIRESVTNIDHVSPRLCWLHLQCRLATVSYVAFLGNRLHESWKVFFFSFCLLLSSLCLCIVSVLLLHTFGLVCH